MPNRFQTFPPVGFDLGKVEAIQDRAEELAQLFDQVGGREGSLALTNLEQAVLWAVKGLTK